MRPSIRRLTAIAVAGAVTLWFLAFLRSATLADWLRANTGEESWWEGIKGAGALAVLAVTGPDLELAPDAPIHHKGANRFGVNTFVQLEADPENVRRSFAMLRDAGIGWARQQFPWEDIEIHARGDFEDRRNTPPRSAWDKYDRIVQTATDHGVQLLVRLDDPPDWAYAAPEREGAKKGPPDDFADFGNFVAAVVERYCGRVRYYQIWNEPNIYPEWGERDVDPAGYARLLATASQRAHAVCGDVVVVGAALAPTTEPGGRNMDDLRYLDALYRAGWQNEFDVLAVQAFGLWTGPTDRRVSADRVNFSRPMLMRDLMVRHNDADKPVWITEFGWDSPPPAMAAPYGRADESLRAEYTREAYDRMAAEWPWVGTAFLWFLRRPDWEWHRRPEGYFRVLEPDWRKTETYLALAGLANRYPVLHRGRHAPDAIALQYNGPWRAVPETGPLDQMVGSESAELQVSFVGTGFRLSLSRRPVTVGGAQPPGIGATASAGGAIPPASTTENPESPAAQATSALSPTLAMSNTSDAVAAGDTPSLFVVLDDISRTLAPTTTDDGFVLDHTDLLDDPGDWFRGKRELDAGEHIMIVRVEAGEAWLDNIEVFGPPPPEPFDPLWAWLLRNALRWALLGGIPIMAWLVWRRMHAGGRSGGDDGGEPAPADGEPLAS